MWLKSVSIAGLSAMMLAACQTPVAPSDDSAAKTAATSTNPVTAARPRIINMTDLGADPDDEQSLVRQLVMANEYDLEGLIVSTGCWKKTQSSTTMLDTIIDAYDAAYPNLKVHANTFPEPGDLRSMTVMGQTGYGMSDVGVGKDTEGSNLIIQAVDRDDPRPVWVMCWGGCNPIAQALWTVSNTRSAEDLEAFVRKLHVYDVLGQDDAGTWIAKNFPDLLYIRATGSVYGWQPSDEWVAEHIQSHGALGAVYPDRKYATEGDTPAFLHVYPIGLNDPTQVSQGGWGGRFTETRVEGIRGMSCMDGEDADYDPYLMFGDAPEGGEAIRRWKSAIENDFEARMDWSVSNRFSDANHHPVAVVNGDTSRDVLNVEADAGDTLTLDATGSNDSDSDVLRFAWNVYEAPSTYIGDVSMRGDAEQVAQLMVPEDGSGKTIHVILEVIDAGSPNLVTYRRVIVSVR